MRWEWVYIGELFQHNTGKALNSSDKSGNPYEYITTSNVYWNRFELDKLKTMLFTDAEIEKCTVQKGDLLMTMYVQNFQTEFTEEDFTFIDLS